MTNTTTISPIVTKLFRGNNAFNQVNDFVFQQKWKAIEKETTSFSVCQSADFVLPWYELYTQFEPIVLSCFQGQKLVGLICLAWHKTKKFLTHAGYIDAEYHGWLATPYAETTFLQQVFTLVQKQFSINNWVWRWLPPSSNVAKLKAAIPKHITFDLEEQNSPIWDLTQVGKLEKIQKSKSIKSKHKRFAKRGNYHLEVIESGNRLASIYDKIIVQHDFRQEATYNLRPYGDDPNRTAFFCQLVDRGIAKMTVLWLDNEVLASHFGIGNQDHVYLCSISYAPSESKQSPGTLLIGKIAEYLNTQGVKIFDLTPGGDSYKERFSNSTTPLAKFTFYFNRLASIKGKTKFFLQHTTIKTARTANIDKLQLKEYAIKANQLGIDLKNLVSNPLNIFKSIKSIFSKKSHYLFEVQLITNKKATVLKEDSISYQKYTDLLAYQGQSPFRNRRALLRLALVQFSKHSTLYSSTNNNNLQWCCWITATKKTNHADHPKIGMSNYLLQVTFCNTPAKIFNYLSDTLAVIATQNKESIFIELPTKDIPKEFLENWKIRMIKNETLCVE